jgi:hypothetical protein
MRMLVILLCLPLIAAAQEPQAPPAAQAPQTPPAAAQAPQTPPAAAQAPQTPPAATQEPQVPKDYSLNVLIVLAIVGLFGALAGFGMYHLYNETYPSIDDMQRLIHNRDLPEYRQKDAESVDGKIDHNNPMLKADLRPMYETIQYIVDAQNAAWNLYLQYIVSIIIGFFVVSLIILGVVRSDAGLPIIATIVGAAIGSAVQSVRTRPTARQQDPAQNQPGPGSHPG